MRRLLQVGVAYLLKVTGALGNRLGAILFQTPPDFEANLDRFREFLDLLPASPRAAFEFRHSSWFNDEVFSCLREHNAALCIAEAESGPKIPFVRTADWGYLRLRRLDYTDPALARWHTQLQAQPWRDAFVFFKHEDEAKGPQFAMRFLQMAEQATKQQQNNTTTPAAPKTVPR